ncbi:MAG: histidine kinase [Bacteroidota bacterium]
MSFVLPLIFFDAMPLLQQGFEVYAPKWFMSFLYVGIYWEGTRMIVLFFRKKFLSFEDTKKRIFRQVIVLLLFAFVVGLLLEKLVCLPLCALFPQLKAMPLEGVIIGDTLLLAWVAVYEGIYFYYQLRNSLLEQEKAKQDHIRSQLEGLRSQVNPHFLFNSLNTLMNIVTEDQKLALRFLKKMSKVYRYMLEIREESIIPLKGELDFIQSYIFLIEERFRGNIKVELEIPDSHLEHQIVPLSLQILFENAIKHNVISTKKPLHIKVFINEDDQLVIQNNLQRKSQVMDSTKVGLENICNRYKLITENKVKIEETEHCFQVALPLIEPVYTSVEA